MFDDLVNKEEQEKRTSSRPKGMSAREILECLKDEFEDANHKHLTKSTSKEAYCNDLECIIIRAFNRAGLAGGQTS